MAYVKPLNPRPPNHNSLSIKTFLHFIHPCFSKTIRLCDISTQPPTLNRKRLFPGAKSAHIHIVQVVRLKLPDGCMHWLLASGHILQDATITSLRQRIHVEQTLRARDLRVGGNKAKVAAPGLPTTSSSPKYGWCTRDRGQVLAHNLA